MTRRILLIHNLYQQAGGEDRVVEAEAEMLLKQGHDVFLYTDDNDRIPQAGRLSTAVQTIWSRSSYSRILALLRENAIELCHFHNTFPLISPAAYYAARRLRIPVVQTLHNYRILCANALLMRNGRICEDCVGRRILWPGAARKCYRESYQASAVAALAISTHRLLGTWTRSVDRYIALTEFARRKFIEGGLPAEKVAIKANFVDPDPGPGNGEGGYVLFVGRLSPEKGIRTLLEAWDRNTECVPLRIAGSGPLAGEVEAAAARNSNVRWLGEISRPEVLEQMRGARLLICPSTWYESFGLIIVEAFATGLPVIASNLGALAELIKVGHTGLLFKPGDPEDLMAKLRWVLKRPDRIRAMRTHARKQYETLYTASRNYETLMSIYDSVLAPPPFAQLATRRLGLNQ
jgi:glycosyltransferase involved in cell wall biosynthesis